MKVEDKNYVIDFRVTIPIEILSEEDANAVEEVLRKDIDEINRFILAGMINQLKEDYKEFISDISEHST